MSVRTPLFALAFLAACAPEEHELDYSEYHPFDDARIDDGVADVASHTTIKEKAEEATLANATTIYAEIEAAFEDNGLMIAVNDLEDAHIEHDGYGLTDAGPFLEAEISDAIGLGMAASSQEHLDWAGETADKALLVYFAMATYSALHDRDRPGIDEAYSLTGLDLEGEPVAGLAAAAAGREAEFGVTLLRPQYEAFIEGQHVIEHGTEDDAGVLGDDAEYDGAIATIDGTLHQTLGLYAIHELDELDSTNADVKLLEARVVWDGLAAWAEEVAPTEAAVVWAGMYPAGVPSRDLTGFYRNELAPVRSGETTIDVATIRAALVTILSAE